MCIGVPYGTSLWQVGDSEQQTGSCKIALAIEKKNFLDRNLNCFVEPPTLTPQDIIPLINEAWKVSFARVGNNNLRTTSERGWGPLNRNLLLHKDIQSSRSKYERFYFNPKNSEGNINHLTPQYLQDTQIKPPLNPNIKKKKVIELNYTYSNSAMVLESFISFQDFQNE